MVEMKEAIVHLEEGYQIYCMPTRWQRTLEALTSTADFQVWRTLETRTRMEGVDLTHMNRLWVSQPLTTGRRGDT
jgi:hypothetical protein